MNQAIFISFPLKVFTCSCVDISVKKIVFYYCQYLYICLYLHNISEWVSQWVTVSCEHSTAHRHYCKGRLIFWYLRRYILGSYLTLVSFVYSRWLPKCQVTLETFLCCSGSVFTMVSRFFTYLMVVILSCYISQWPFS